MLLASHCCSQVNSSTGLQSDMSEDPKFYNLEEVDALALKVLPKAVHDYFAAGADTETTVRDNRQAFQRLRLVPRVMVNVANIDLTYELLGRKLSMPVLVAPMSAMLMAHKEGEPATARAAVKANTSMIVSTMATTSLEDVAKASKGSPLLIFQLYVQRDRDFTASLIRKAERSGYGAIMVTVDSPRVGNREADERNKYRIREDLAYQNLKDLSLRVQPHDKISAAGTVNIFNSNMDDTLTWDFVTWVKTVTKIPLFVKGVLSPRDARSAVDAGVDGIVLSNHGGRQLDHSPAPLDMVASVRRAIGTRVPLLMDGGIRRGTDVLKALALGADAVLLGRPVMFGLALDGQKGVERILELLKRELELAMVLAGCSSLQDISKDLVMEYPASML
ncbi:hypothetical protein WJX79_003021 [Trebouxia sp. C0005]